nr:hypothetical protein 9 [Desulfobulbaceae bacterium]
MDRIYLHPISSKQKLHMKHFRKQKQGVTADNVRLTHFEATPNNKVVNQAYRAGILVEYPDGRSTTVFGNANEIAGVAKQIEADPSAVMKRIRPVGQSRGGNYYLGGPAPSEPQNKLSPQQINEAAGPLKIYPNQGQEDWPRTRAGEEKAAFKQHLFEVAEKTFGGVHPSSSDGQKAVKQALDAAHGVVNKTSVLGDGS